MDSSFQIKDVPGLIFRYPLLWHVLFWIFIYVFYSFAYGNADEYHHELISNLYIMPVRIAGTYAFIYYVVPLFLLRKKYFSFTVLAILHAALFGFALWAVFRKFVYCPGCIFDVETAPLLDISRIFRLIIANYEIPAIAAIVVITKRWYLDQQINYELRKEKLESELKFLKSQIHPHFLFNTLNNLYALTLKRSVKASDVVIKLSHIMHYLLYQSTKEEVRLSEEINLIKAYMELEEIRYGNRLSLTFSMQGNPSDKKIAPLLLLPFIENSFKHGVSNEIDNPFIEIRLDITEGFLKMKVLNSSGKQNGDIDNKRIGLRNVKRRLELLYRDKYDLQINKKNGTFEVFLQMDWNKNQKEG